MENVIEEEKAVVKNQAEKVSKKEGKTYLVTFNQNRSFELFIGRQMFYFEPYSSLVLTDEEINHPDFLQQSGQFSKKEI